MSQNAILIVEDDRDINNMLCHALKKVDCAVHSAKDGAEALKLLNELDLKLVVLDMNLPYVSGAEILRFIRSSEKLKRLTVIIVTVYGADYTGQFRHQADYIFQKPYALQTLRQAVEQSLHV